MQESSPSKAMSSGELSEATIEEEQLALME